MDGTHDTPLDDTDRLRCQAYRLLALLLARPPEDDLLAALARLGAEPSTPFGQATQALAEAAAATTPAAVEREFSRLFIGLELGEVTPYGSWYLEGMLHGTPLIRMRDDLARLSLARAPGICEPEDHAAVALDTMADLIDGRQSGRSGDAGTQFAFFQRHVARWMPRLFADIRKAETAEFYRPVAAFAAAFLDIEEQAFTLPDAAADQHP